MAEPAPPTRAGLGATLKKIPPWGWAVGIGGTLGIGYALYRGRRDPTAQEAPAGETDLAGYTEYDLATQPSPGGAYYPSQPIIAEPAETVGAVGQTALETVVGGITGIIESLPGIIEASRPPDPVPVTDLPAAPAPQPLTPAPAPAPAPQGVTVLGRRFPNAVRSAEIPTPRLQSRDFNIHFPGGRVERWRTWTDKGQRKWRKIA